MYKVWEYMKFGTVYKEYTLDPSSNYTDNVVTAARTLHIEDDALLLIIATKNVCIVLNVHLRVHFIYCVS